MSKWKQIEASRVTVADDVRIGESSIIRGEEVILRPGVRIGEGVEIVCDSLDMGPGCTIGADTRILCPQISFAERCSIGPGVEAEVNQYLRLDRFGYIGARVSMVGQGISAGEYLFLDRDIIIGGGGARGPRAFLTLGKANSLHARSIINLSEPVTMGDYSGISSYVSLVTHYAYQPVLMGYGARFAPISIADHVAIYINAIILPGVTVGAWATIGAGAVVVKDVPAHCMAVGNPAQVIRGPEDYPTPLDERQKDALVRSILADYLTTLEPKGVKVLNDSILSQGYATVEFEDKQEVIRYIEEQQLAPRGPQSAFHDEGELAPRGPQSAFHGEGELARRGPQSALHGEGELAPRGPQSAFHGEGGLAPRGPQSAFHGEGELARRGPQSAFHGAARPDITLSLGPVPAELWGRCHFDLQQETMVGQPSRIAEDLRDYLRRRAIRIFTGQPFQTLPLVNLQRLQRRRSG